jgi:stearoyl-CoA desaturase (delta-9 desaturase)
MREPTKLLLLQIVAHIALLYCIYNITWLVAGILLSVYFLTGCIGMTCTYHRLLSHKSWNAPQWFTIVGTICGIWGLTGSPLAWVATHREHHRFSDQESDPHSPITDGFWKTQILSMYHTVKITYVKDMLRDNFMLWTHNNYFKIHYGLIISSIIGCIFFPANLILSVYLAPAAILWHMGSFINTINHLWGYRFINTGDHSCNNLFTGYLVWGEGWHNTHHSEPKSPKFGRKWWELDIGWQIIKLFSVAKKDQS